MKLYNYRGLDGERAPDDVTHVTVDRSVTEIKMYAFYRRKHLVSVIMGDNVKRIECWAFFGCRAFRFVRLSKTLEYIGEFAFNHCKSFEALFLPSTVKEIGNSAFSWCESMRLLIPPNDIGIDYIGCSYGTFEHDTNCVISHAGIEQIANTAGVRYIESDEGEILDVDSIDEVHEWLIHHMDEFPLHKLCYESSVTAKHINDYLNDHGNDSVIAIDSIHGMTPLHMLTMNPNAPADAIAALFQSNMQAVFCKDNQQKTPLDYAKEYNVGGLLEMMNGLCRHHFSSV